MVPKLVSCELLVRRFQLIEEKYKFKLPQFDGGRGGILATLHQQAVPTDR